MSGNSLSILLSRSGGPTGLDDQSKPPQALQTPRSWGADTTSASRVSGLYPAGGRTGEYRPDLFTRRKDLGYRAGED